MKNIRVSDDLHKKLLQIQAGYISKTGEKVFLHDIVAKIVNNYIVTVAVMDSDPNMTVAELKTKLKTEKVIEK